ncbi:uncharacterized protein LOC124553848 [Schistocerca americana]|uniref:uncharacterized protein LOC124553848 n=1 Tax=Schistocerca americana TaxID=7009 RepID=UPI001F502599|nr:uncharacterized protein LOC124553848 [Schistocerca americana]XP_046983795.1 uncharacterized protein LOC124553848 [Schistocerca americana]
MNTTFYPTHLTIYSHVYRALKKLKKSVFDQDALQMQINEWQKEYRGDNIFFRPFSDVDGEIQPLLFCYESAWQEDILKKYGDVCLLDATYKTTKYDIPLFFVTVKANRCCLVVGFFFIQVEDTRSIAEALLVFKRWNTNFDPTYWVTDFSESEIAAIKEIFPFSKVYLCSFHREQARGRWVKKGGNLTVGTDKESVLELWRYVATSPTEEQFELNVEMLETLEVFRRNPKALIYFKNQWLSLAEKWVRAFENIGIFANIRTTNGVETMNEKVKKSFLNYDTDKTLTGVVKVLVNSFIPGLMKKYCQMNSVIRKNNEVVPAFLHGKT